MDFRIQGGGNRYLRNIRDAYRLPWPSMGSRPWHWKLRFMPVGGIGDKLVAGAIKEQTH
jgi:hypothetical protein